MKDQKTTNTLLLMIVIPLVIYLLKMLSFIFVPLVFAMFITLLFLPMMRWFHKNKIPKAVRVIVIIILFIGIMKAGSELVRLAINGVVSNEGNFTEVAESKLTNMVISVEDFFGIERIEGENIFMHYIMSNSAFSSFNTTINYIGDTLSMILMTVFFTLLLLAESINFQIVLNKTLFVSRYSSIRTFVKIEHEVLKFVKVKIFISLLTGVLVGVLCYLFGISFPVLWGLLTFILNFIQVVGSITAFILVSLFALIELGSGGTLLFFILSVLSIQLLLGSVLEPVMMGKTFAINIVTVLIMLMLWGYIWGIPGLIMAVPITVILKIILEQFPRTKTIASLMGGYSRPIPIPWKRGGKEKST
ncbi:MAG: AI-2E family transporter [Bacteroidales bacterium]